jgi:hypothetical protein
MLRRLSLLGSLLVITLTAASSATADLSMVAYRADRIAPGGGNFIISGTVSNDTSEEIFISSVEISAGNFVAENFIQEHLVGGSLKPGASYSGEETNDGPSSPGWTCSVKGLALLTVNTKPGTVVVDASFYGRTASDDPDFVGPIGTFQFYVSMDTTYLDASALTLPVGKKLKVGSTIQVTFTASNTDCFDLTSVPLAIVNLSGGAPAVLSPATSNSKKAIYFHYDPLLNAYVFNWSTKGLTPGDYYLQADLPQGFQSSGYVTLVK